jgi:hypothetical protein
MKGSETAATAPRAPVFRPPIAAGAERARAVADSECSVIADSSKEGEDSERSDVPRGTVVNLFD